MRALVDGLLANFEAKQRFLSVRWLSETQLEPELHWIGGLCPAAFKATEAVDEGFSASLRCFLPVAAYPLDRLLGRTVEVGYPAQWGRRLHLGLVSAVCVEGESAGYLWFELSLQDGFTVLKHNRRSRIFNELNALQITEQVFESLGQQSAAFARLIHLDAQALAAGLTPASHPPMAFTLQYEESDFAFLSRLWQREGWHWHIETRQTPEDCFQALVLSCGAQTWPLLSPVRYHRSHATEVSDTVQAFQRRTALSAQQVAAGCFDYRRAEALLSVAGGVTGAGAAYAAALDMHAFLDNGAATDPHRLEHLTQALAAQAMGKPVAFEGRGNVRHFAVGSAFEWESACGFDAFNPVFESHGSVYGITALKIEVNNSFSEKHAVTEVVYANSFFAVPVNQPFGYDRLSPTPSVFTLTGCVVGAQAGSSDEGNDPTGSVFTDDLGRIKVQFHFSGIQNRPAHQTAFLRVMQNAASQGYGQLWLPRVGDEVVVQFMGGCPDRPVVMGSVYNAANVPPSLARASKLPEDAALSGVRTRVLSGSSIGLTDAASNLHVTQAWQGSELVFDDTPGQLQLRLACDVADSRIALGAVTTPRRQGLASLRGVGWEIHTQGSGVMRAGAGALLSTLAGDGQVGLMEIAPLLRHWDAQRLSDKALLKQAQQRSGFTMDLPVLAFLSEPMKQDAGLRFSQPALVQHSAAGWYAAAVGELALSSGGLLSQRSGADMLLTSQARLSLNARTGLALYAASGAMQLQAEAGGLLLQAFAGALELQAAGPMELTSSNEGISLRAAKFIELRSGGACVRLSNGSIEIHAPGGLDLRGSTKQLGGGVESVAELPEFQPQSSKPISRGSTVSVHALGGAALPQGHRLLHYTEEAGRVTPQAAPSAMPGNIGGNAQITVRKSDMNEQQRELLLVGQGVWQSVFTRRQAGHRSESLEKHAGAVAVEDGEGEYFD